MPLNADIIAREIPQAIARLSGRTPVASAARTADWERVALGLRDRAFFSAGVEEIKTVAAMRSKLDEWADFANRDPQRAFMDRSRFVAEMRGLLGAAEGDSGRLTDITSRRRLELVYNFQTTDAAEYARFIVGQDAAILDEFPCQELVRIEERKEPRDWPSRWIEAGGTLMDGGRMIARKDDPIWVEISAFGRPWPPFDFESGMGLADVDRAEAEALGVIAPQDRVLPQLENFNRKLETSVAGLDDSARAELRAMFGDQVLVAEDKAQWQGGVVRDFVGRALAQPQWQDEIDLGGASAEAVKLAAPMQDLADYRLTWLTDDARHMWDRHGPASGDPHPLNRLDFELVPHVWRAPDAVRAGRGAGNLKFEKEILGRTILVEWERSKKQKLMQAKTLYKP